jgi:hypothetical protein
LKKNPSDFYKLPDFTLEVMRKNAINGILKYDDYINQQCQNLVCIPHNPRALRELLYDMRIKALELSIEKWEDIAHNHGIDLKGKNCACCRLFNCFHCPIRCESGCIQCENTPYEKWLVHHCTVHRQPGYIHKPNLKILCNDCQKYADAEIEYLKKILTIEKEAF